MKDNIFWLIAALVLLMGWLRAAATAFGALRDGKAFREEGEVLAGWPRLKRLWERGEAVSIALRLAMGLLMGGLLSLLYGYFADGVIAIHGVESLWLWAWIIACAATLLLMPLWALIPRKLAQRSYTRTLRYTASTIDIVFYILRPLAVGLQFVTERVTQLIGVQDGAKEEEVTEEEIRKMVDMGGETGAIEEAEKEMIENIFEFNNRTAEDVMTPRTNVTCLWVEDPRDTVLDTIRMTGLSRFPVYDEDMDDIVGILSTREYLLELQADAPRPLRDIIREAYFVPETIPADTLFRNLQGKKTHLAIVVDEYGGMSGIVTMEDLLEEIVGNIYDEFDPQSTADAVQVDDNLWRLSGSIPLSEVEELLVVALPEEDDYGTLGGLIFSQFDTIPQDGSQPVLDVAGLHIQVEEIADHRVITALVSKVMDDPVDTSVDGAQASIVSSVGAELAAENDPASAGKPDAGAQAESTGKAEPSPQG